MILTVARNLGPAGRQRWRLSIQGDPTRRSFWSERPNTDSARAPSEEAVQAVENAPRTPRFPRASTATATGPLDELSRNEQRRDAVHCDRLVRFPMRQDSAGRVQSRGEAIRCGKVVDVGQRCFSGEPTNSLAAFALRAERYRDREARITSTQVTWRQRHEKHDNRAGGRFRGQLCPLALWHGQWRYALV